MLRRATAEKGPNILFGLGDVSYAFPSRDFIGSSSPGKR